MTNFPLYTQTCDAINAIFESNKFDIELAGLEGLNSSFIGRMFVSIVDTFGQLCHTAFSNITNIHKGLKRSELNEFVQSNALKMRTVDGIPYNSKMDADVDIPANMKGSYKTAVVSLIQVYTKLSAIPTTKLCSTSFNEIVARMTTSNGSQLAGQIENLSSILSRTVAVAKPAIDTAMSKFDGKFSYKAKFSDVFLSNSEWVEVRKMLIDNEDRLQDVGELADKVSSIEASLKEIARLAEDPETAITQKDLKNMSEIAKNVALILDSYGMTATRHMAIEHNYVLCANHLYDTCK